MHSNRPGRQADDCSLVLLVLGENDDEDDEDDRAGNYRDDDDAPSSISASPLVSAIVVTAAAACRLAHRGSTRHRLPRTNSTGHCFRRTVGCHSRCKYPPPTADRVPPPRVPHVCASVATDNVATTAVKRGTRMPPAF